MNYPMGWCFFFLGENQFIYRFLYTERKYEKFCYQLGMVTDQENASTDLQPKVMMIKKN